MPRFRRLTATQVREKSSPLDLVTEADEVAEAVITTGLKAAFPDAIVLPSWPIACTSRSPGACMRWRRD
jgi:fructose-1,6-bisphosphatase/inositol monophosphatase family enzyme